jgi:hypothetical protein
MYIKSEKRKQTESCEQVLVKCNLNYFSKNLMALLNIEFASRQIRTPSQIFDFLNLMLILMGLF